MLDLSFKIIDILRIDATPNRIAAAVALGIAAGLIPTLTLIGVLLFLFLFVLRVHIPLAAFTFTFFSVLALLLTGPIGELGNVFLAYPPLLDLWSWLYHAPVFPFTQFNNTVVMGGLILSSIFSPVIFIGLRIWLGRSLSSWPQRIADSRFRTSRLYRYYVEYQRSK